MNYLNLLNEALKDDLPDYMSKQVTKGWGKEYLKLDSARKNSKIVEGKWLVPAELKKRWLELIFDYDQEKVTRALEPFLLRIRGDEKFKQYFNASLNGVIMDLENMWLSDFFQLYQNVFFLPNIKQTKETGILSLSKNTANFNTWISKYNQIISSKSQDGTITWLEPEIKTNAFNNTAITGPTGNVKQVDFKMVEPDAELYLYVSSKPDDILRMSISKLYDSCQNFYTGSHNKQLIANVFDKNMKVAYIIWNKPWKDNFGNEHPYMPTGRSILRYTSDKKVYMDRVYNQNKDLLAPLFYNILSAVYPIKVGPTDEMIKQRYKVTLPDSDTAILKMSPPYQDTMSTRVDFIIPQSLIGRAVKDSSLYRQLKDKFGVDAILNNIKTKETRSDMSQQEILYGNGSDIIKHVINPSEEVVITALNNNCSKALEFIKNEQLTAPIIDVIINRDYYGTSFNRICQWITSNPENASTFFQIGVNQTDFQHLANKAGARFINYLSFFTPEILKFITPNIEEYIKEFPGNLNKVPFTQNLFRIAVSQTDDTLAMKLFKKYKAQLDEDTKIVFFSFHLPLLAQFKRIPTGIKIGIINEDPAALKYLTFNDKELNAIVSNAPASIEFVTDEKRLTDKTLKICLTTEFKTTWDKFSYEQKKKFARFAFHNCKVQNRDAWNKINPMNYAFEYIDNPTLKECKIAVENSPSLITKIKNPPPALQMLAAKRTLTHVVYLDNIDVNVQKYIAKKNPYNFYIIKNPDRRAILYLLTLNVNNVQYLNKLDDDIALYLLSKKPELLPSIQGKNSGKKVQEYIFTKHPELFHYFTKPIISLAKKILQTHPDALKDMPISYLKQKEFIQIAMSKDITAAKYGVPQEWDEATQLAMITADVSLIIKIINPTIPVQNTAMEKEPRVYGILISMHNNNSDIRNRALAYSYDRRTRLDVKYNFELSPLVFEVEEKLMSTVQKINIPKSIVDNIRIANINNIFFSYYWNENSARNLIFDYRTRSERIEAGWNTEIEQSIRNYLLPDTRVYSNWTQEQVDEFLKKASRFVNFV